MSRINFGLAAVGDIPDSAKAGDIKVAGKRIDVSGLDIVTAAIGQWAQGAHPASPTDLLVQLGPKHFAKGQAGINFTAVAPGGRPASELPGGLLKGKATFTPKPDMYGPPVT